MKRPVIHLSMRSTMTLLVLAELGVVLMLGWLISALMHYFDITLQIPDVVWYLAAGVSLGVAVTVLLGKWLFDPVTRLGTAMRQVAQGNFSVRLNGDFWFKEINDIYESFNLMAGELGATEILQTDFVSNVSHEFKTPITAIEGYAMLLQGSETPASEEQAQYVEKILVNTRRLSSLVGNILLLSKVDNQSIQTPPVSFRLDEQIRQSIVLLEPEWGPKELEFDVELERIAYTGNEALLVHVWNNLIGNAVKFTPPEGTVAIRLFSRGTGVVFEIEDTGPGIEEAALKHVFDRFYQSDSSHKAEGNGLGLALVKQITEACGGSVSVKNRPEGGCCFTVVLKRNAT